MVILEGGEQPTWPAWNREHNQHEFLRVRRPGRGNLLQRFCQYPRDSTAYVKTPGPSVGPPARVPTTPMLANFANAAAASRGVPQSTPSMPPLHSVSQPLSPSFSHLPMEATPQASGQAPPPTTPSMLLMSPPTNAVPAAPQLPLKA